MSVELSRGILRGVFLTVLCNSRGRWLTARSTRAVDNLVLPDNRDTRMVSVDRRTGIRDGLTNRGTATHQE